VENVLQSRRGFRVRNRHLLGSDPNGPKRTCRKPTRFPHDARPDMTPVETVSACVHPTGTTYDRPTRHVWVACYGGEIRVYDDR